MRILIELEGLTFGELYNFVDLARGARIGSEQPVRFDDGNRPLLTAELDATAVDAPVLLRRSDAARYVEALSRELSQDHDKADLDALRRLLDDLAEGTT